jgi:hypothetical protein
MLAHAMKKPFKAIRIKSPGEFECLVEHLTDEAFRVRDHRELWAALDKSFDQYSLELNQTPTFWELTSQAYKDAVILRLGRLFDPHPAASSLGNLLQTFKENVSAPSTALPSVVASLSVAELNQEISSVAGSDPIVKKLLTLRHEYLAHRGAKHVASGTFASLPTLGADEIVTLLNRALDILQKYRDHLGFPPILWGHWEVRDFESLLELLRDGLQERGTRRIQVNDRIQASRFGIPAAKTRVSYSRTRQKLVRQKWPSCVQANVWRRRIATGRGLTPSAMAY